MPEDKLSFIPQKTLTPSFYKRRGPGILIVFSFLLFLVSLLVYGGLFLYRNNLKKEIDNLADSLERAKAAFEIPLINQISQISEKINSSKKLLEQHISTAPIFDFLEKNTLKDVRFKNFRYSASAKEGLVILMDGVAKNYSTLALQGDVFEKDKNVKGVSFSGLNLGEKGAVNFNTKLFLDSSLLIYKGE